MRLTFECGVYSERVVPRFRFQARSVYAGVSSVDDAARLLTERYEVDDATAARDAAAWVEKLRDCKLI